MTGGKKSRWRPVTSSVPHGSLLEPTLFNIFNDQDDETECKSANDTKLEEEVDMKDSCAAIQRDFDVLEKWANRNLMEFSKGKCQILHLEKNNPISTDRGINDWKTTWQEKTWWSCWKTS